MQKQYVNTDLTFFTNESDSSLYDPFVSILKDVKYFDILVGYFHSSGFFRLYKSFENIEKIRILVGLSLDKRTFQIIETTNNEDFESHARVKEYFGDLLISEIENSADAKEVEEGILKFVEFIKSGKIEIKAHPGRNIHAKVYISRYREDDRDFGNVITGSSNFSEAGLIANYEFNVQLKNSADVKYALEKFEQLWNEAVDISEHYVDTITQRTHLSDKITPYELYLKFLYEYFETVLSVDDDLFFQSLPPGFLKLKYQEQAVINAKRILEEYGGVFLADVVGLGKTYDSAMLAKQLPGRNLVIASPTLLDEENPHSWKNVFYSFNIPAKYISVGNLEKFFRGNDDNYENVFIDEAHKFRNETNFRYENLARICAGKKVILVTATPLNNTPMVRILKILKSKEMRSYQGFTSLDEEYLGSVRQLLEQGALPKKTAAKIYKRIKDETEPLEILKIMRSTLAPEFLKKLSVSGEKWRSLPEEVILSECFVK